MRKSLDDIVKSLEERRQEPEEPPCQTCGGLRFVRVADRTARRCPDCGPNIEQRLATAGVPAKLLAKQWTLGTHGEWPAGLALPSAERPVLTIWGPTGNGKSTAAVRLLRLNIENGRRGRYVELPALLEDLRTLYGKNESGQAAELRESVRTFPGLLVLDEVFGTLGSGKDASDMEREIVQAVYHYRGSRCLPTIITTMLSVRGLYDLSPMLGSRALENAYEMKGKDYRLAAYKVKKGAA